MLFRRGKPRGERIAIGAVPLPERIASRTEIEQDNAAIV
jgi:hypothetical protein